MSKRAAGVALIGVALLFVLAAFAWRSWQNSDTQQAKRETDALTRALVLKTHYVEPDDPPMSGFHLMLGAAGVLFLGGIVLVAVSPPGEPDASDRQPPGPAAP